MNTKEIWINQFIDCLGDYWAENGQVFNGNLAYQYATACFDWGTDGQPETTVDVAFTRFVMFDKGIFK